MSDDVFDLSPICPRCGLCSVHPSKAQTWADVALRFVCFGPYRCHTCLKRFTWFMSPFTRLPDRDVHPAKSFRAAAGR